MLRALDGSPYVSSIQGCVTHFPVYSQTLEMTYVVIQLECELKPILLQRLQDNMVPSKSGLQVKWQFLGRFDSLVQFTLITHIPYTKCHNRRGDRLLLA